MKTNEGKVLVEDIHKLQAKRSKQVIMISAPVQVVKGIWVFAEGIALLITSLYAIDQAHYGHAPLWGKYILTVAGVLVLLPAAHLLGKFFRNVGSV